jgi:hypothetical protein
LGGANEKRLLGAGVRGPLQTLSSFPELTADDRPTRWLPPLAARQGLIESFFLRIAAAIRRRAALERAPMLPLPDGTW